jgi:transposase-like protein/IS1 family transposase
MRQTGCYPDNQEDHMNLQRVFCPNKACRDKHQVGKGNIVAHSQKQQRCKCTSCGHTFSYRRGTIFYGLRTNQQIVTWAVGLVAWGCPVAAIVAVFELDERTVADWMHRAGLYAEAFHHQHVQKVDLQQVQVDEIRLKMQRQILWIAMAMSVGSRLWLGAVCQVRRDKKLAKQIMTCIYNWAKQVPLVIAFDGWNAYPKACYKVFREPILTGKMGGPRKQPWACLSAVQLVKQERQKWVMQRWVLSGSCSAVRYLLNVTQGLGTTINTAYIERLNATFRAHLASFARRSRCPARQLQTVGERLFLVGCLYNFCWLHTSLDRKTPAMAAGLTDHRWSLEEFLWARLLPYFASTA